MSTAQARLAAFGCLALGVLGVYISRRPTTDIAAGALGGLGFCYFLVSSTAGGWKTRAARKRQQQVRETPWSMYSRPLNGDPGMWEVGIERRTSEGRPLDPNLPAMKVLTEEASFDIAVAEEEAKVKATHYNDNRVGMPPAAHP